MNDVEIASEAPISEALKNKEAANTNNLIDEKDAQETRLDALEALVPNFEESDLTDVSAASHAGLVAGSSVALTSVAASSIVQITIESRLGSSAARFSSSTSGTLTLKRGAGVASSRFTAGSAESNLNTIFTDTAPDTGTNTYTLEWTTSGPNVEILSARIIALEVRH